MFRSLLSTTDDRAALVARLTLALVMFPHGMQKLAGWFGGHGFDGTMGFFTQSLGIPAALAVLAILTEVLAPVALALGLVGRAAALGIVGVMIGADDVHFRPAITVRAHSEEWGQVLLSFDKARGLLLRMKGQLDRDGLEPIRLERVYSQHKESNGVVIPMKVAMYRNGQLDTEMVVTEVELVDRLDPAIFAAPQ